MKRISVKMSQFLDNPYVYICQYVYKFYASESPGKLALASENRRIGLVHIRGQGAPFFPLLNLDASETNQ